MKDVFDLRELFEAHDEIWEVVKDLPTEFFYTTMCCVIDEYSAANGINNRVAWKAIYECSKAVFEERGGANYAKGWKNEEV